MREEEHKLEEEMSILDATSKLNHDVYVLSSKHSVIENKIVRQIQKFQKHLIIDSMMLTSVVQHLCKPTSSLKKFSGDPMKYHKFVRQFKCKVECNTDDPQ